MSLIVSYSEHFRRVGSLDECRFHCPFSSFGSLEPLKNLMEEEKEETLLFDFSQSEKVRVSSIFRESLPYILTPPARLDKRGKNFK